MEALEERAVEFTYPKLPEMIDLKVTKIDIGINVRPAPDGFRRYYALSAVRSAHIRWAHFIPTSISVWYNT